MCAYGVWDQGYNFDMSKIQDELVEKDRKNFCFFWKYRPGMFLPAAKILQEREAQARDSSKDRKLTIWGLWIAATALGVNVYLQLAQAAKLWPYLNDIMKR